MIAAPLNPLVGHISKSYDAILTCFDFNYAGTDGPYALFTVGDKKLRIPVHMTSDELREIISVRRCRLTINVHLPHRDADLPGAGDKSDVK